MRNRVITPAEFAAVMALLPDNQKRLISAADVREAFRPLYKLTIDVNEPLIREWISEGSLFQGTVRETQAQGSIALSALPAVVTANKGQYWTVAEAFTVSAGPLQGLTLDVGDWIQSLGDDTIGLTGWTVVSGGLLTEAIADGLYVPLNDNPHPLMGFISAHGHANDFSWNDLDVARPMWDNTVPTLGTWVIASSVTNEGEIEFDGVNLKITQFDESGVLGNSQIAQNAWIDGSSLIRFTDAAVTSRYTEGRIVASSISAIAGGMSLYSMRLDSVIEVGGGVDFRSFGDKARVAITRTPNVVCFGVRPRRSPACR